MLRRVIARRFSGGAVLFLTLSFSPLAQGADFTVHDGETVGLQTLNGTGDTGTIETGGTIDESGNTAHAVDALGDDNTVNNEGTITGSGDNSTGIYSIGANAMIDNGGLIERSGNFVAGIYSGQDGAHIINRGSITISGFQGAGISSAGDNALIDNRGTITINTQTGLGIYSTLNSGAVIRNSGTINASGTSSVGIYTPTTDGAAIFNSGTINATGAGSSGIIAGYLGTNAVITNSGRIISTDTSAGYAIQMYGAATLNLLPGTTIYNDFYFNAPADSHLNIGTGLNTALAFYYGFPTDLDTSGQPYVISGGVLAVADPTGLAAADSFAFDLTRAINDAVGANAGTGNGGGDATTDAGPGHGIWATGLGLYGDHKAADTLDGYSYGAGGFVAGIDRSLTAESNAGVFAGLSVGKIATDADSTRVDTYGGFAGAYWNQDNGVAFKRASFTVGGLSSDSDRTVANNKVLGGLETAEANYGSFYLSPAITLGFHHKAGAAVVSPSLGLRYTGLYRAGYTETGSLADMAVAAGTSQSIDIRGEVKTDFAPKITDAGVHQFDVRVGVDGIFNWGNAVGAELLGSDIALLAGGRQSTVRGFVGAGTTFTQANGTLFNIGVEGSYDTAAALTGSASASLRRAF